MPVADVTVIIPTRNREAQIVRALESVQKQTLQPTEVIVVDDASADRTVEVLEGRPVTLIRHEEAKGSGAARNTGIAAARSSYIAFLDSDDEWLPDHLARVVPRLEDHVFVTAPMVDSFGRVRGNINGQTAAVDAESLFFPENIVCTSTVVARRDSIDLVGGFDDLPRAQDLDLWIRLLDRGTAIAISDVTALYAIPAPYQDQDLRSRSLAGAERVRARYADRPWMTRRLASRIRCQVEWDDLRHAQHRGDRRAVAQSAARLARHPLDIPGLVELLAHRRKARRVNRAL